jgi:hypothetical protein
LRIDIIKRKKSKKYFLKKSKKKMNLLILISVLFSIANNCNAVDIDECWKDYYPRSVNSIHDAGNRDCGAGGYYAAGLCYPPCGQGEVRQTTGWCKKSSGILYISGSPFQPKCNAALEEQAGLCYV